MDLKGIMAISGYPGLFKMVSQAKNTVIVESMIDGKRMPAFNTYKISTLEDIAIYTEGKEIPLREVFVSIYTKEETKACPDFKSDNNAMKEYFGTVVPDYDRERVYVSDIKKVLGWYNLLHSKGLVDDKEPVVEEPKTEEVVAEAKAEVAEKEAKPKKAPAKKKAAAEGVEAEAKPKAKKKAKEGTE